MENKKFLNPVQIGQISNSTINNHVQAGLLKKSVKEDMYINVLGIQKLIREKLLKHGLNINGCSDQKVFLAINSCIETYLSNMLESLIKISRVRQNSFEHYSKLIDKKNVIIT